MNRNSQMVSKFSNLDVWYPSVQGDVGIIMLTWNTFSISNLELETYTFKLLLRRNASGSIILIGLSDSILQKK